MMARGNDAQRGWPAVGQRGKLIRIVERFPHFWVSAGATGTVTVATSDLIALRMDEQIPGAEEWDNELCWSADDAALYAGSAPQRIAAAFYADAELTDGTDGTVVAAVTAEQSEGIAASKATYAANERVELIGLRLLWSDDKFRRFPDDAAIVEFTYREAGDDPGGRPGREVTVFAADGQVLDSQDFG